MSETADIDSMVRTQFKVKDYYATQEGLGEYSVVYDDEARRAFRGLYEKVGPLGYTPRLSGTRENAVLSVSKTPPGGGPVPRTSIFLALLSVVSIIAAGWFLGTSYSHFFGGSALFDGVSFILGVVVILVTHDLVQRYFARRAGRVQTLPYYLPNIPVFLALPVLYFLPTFGAVTFLRSPAYDRNSLFDFYYWGAIAALLVTMVVALAGVPSTVVLTQAQYTSLFGSGSGVLSHGASVLQDLATGVMASLNLSPAVPTDGYAFLSPVSTAAWVGFLLSVFSLMPAALFDGGRLATLILGTRGSRITTLVTAFLLVAVDSPNYWVVFLLLFLLAAIQPSNETLDSVSGVSRSRKVLFLVAMVLLLLCVPVPQTFLTFPI